LQDVSFGGAENFVLQECHAAFVSDDALFIRRADMRFRLDSVFIFTFNYGIRVEVYWVDVLEAIQSSIPKAGTTNGKTP
jgi:hypothetical protein